MWYSSGMMILNENVRVALKNNPKLSGPFVILHRGYDEEIDPLHNPDFVEQAKADELVKLAKAQGFLREAEALLSADLC
jgi:hypothetical protein